MIENIENFEGNLKVEDSRAVVLETTNMNYYLIPYPMYVALPIEVMKMDAVRKYQDYLDREVTVTGMPQDDLIWDARIIRTHEPRPEPEDYGENYWNNRIPKADIVFKARKLPGYSVHFSVDVRQMITINDSFIRKDLETHGLLVSDVENCNGDMYRIYRHTRIKETNPYDYEYDNQIFGCEFFMYPYELRVLGKGDCDDWGIEIASYLISAGVPEWRVRCVVGQTFSGGGHLTVYVLADDLTNWHHLNSTTSWWTVEAKGWNQITDFPKAGDPSDTIGIEDVWFSFNNKYAWHAFETHTSEDEARKTSWMKNFKITPRFD